ncbi:hypothetical protein RNJ44_04784 [Nakaseomyces bracarensis]|uniref:proline--tRNA ligase n=1 Tax=Nakaseomyces bracarensis TaxID=273131 RepID=A0ABR4NW03_9SACH
MAIRRLIAKRTVAHNAFLPKSVELEAWKSKPTQEVLQNLGFVRKTQSGLFNWLPLGLRTVRKLENLIRQRMENDAGAMEVSLSSLSARSIWDKTGRWDKSKELFKVKDTNDVEYCLIPTCEEDITDLTRNYISSHKDMPLIAYQIGRKYRDEKRPRGGLLRGREFTMKDAYSFASSEEQALELFNKMDSVYDKLFTDLKVPFKSALADSGEIGGEMSKEYHFLDPIGEDTVFTCDSCGTSSTIEKCDSLPDVGGQHTGDVDVIYGLSEDHATLICFYFPRGRNFNWNLAQKVLDNDIDMSIKEYGNDKVLQAYQEENEDYMFTKILRVMDIRINSRSNFPDFPLSKYLKHNFGQIDEVSIVDAVDQEICARCEEGTLQGSKSIEVGHIFHLGDKYSKPLGAKFRDENNNESIISMGCYGIGVSRLIGAIAEIGRDERGLKWPQVIAPYQISIITNKKDDITPLKEQIKQSFDTFDLDFEGAKLGFGGRIKLSHAIGIPLCIIVGSKSWPNVEIEVRSTDEKIVVPHTQVIDKIKQLLAAL